jgi:hypothetical protein
MPENKTIELTHDELEALADILNIIIHSSTCANIEQVDLAMVIKKKLPEPYQYKYPNGYFGKPKNSLI